MKRLPIALGLALVVVVATVAYITVTPKTTNSVIYINATTVPFNVTLPAFPSDAIVVRWNVSYPLCVSLKIPGGIVHYVEYGDVYMDSVDVGCFGRYVIIYFNGTIVDSANTVALNVVRPPKYVVISVTE